MFLPIVFTLFLLTFGYLGQQLIEWPGFAWQAQILLWPLLALPFGLILWLPLVHWRDDSDQPASRFTTVLMWGAFVSMAVLSFTLLLTLLRNVAWFAGARRDSLYTPGVTGAIMATSGLLLALGMLFARKTPRIKHVRVPIAGLPEGLEGLKIAQITDLHVGATIKRPFVESVVGIVNSLEADLVALTGDIFDGEPRDLTADYAPLGTLNSRLGCFYVTGNHEYYWGVHQWLEVVRKLGIVPLENTHQLLMHGETRFAVAGVNDFWAGRYDKAHAADPANAIKGVSAETFKILLAHQPQTALSAAPHGYHLQLSGHTHGGQFIPWSLIIRLFHKFAKGLYTHQGMRIYVSRGTGYWGPPVRLGSPSEITLLTLSRE